MKLRLEIIWNGLSLCQQLVILAYFYQLCISMCSKFNLIHMLGKLPIEGINLVFETLQKRGEYEIT